MRWLGRTASLVEQMVEANDALTASLFADKPLDRKDQLRAFQLRQAISHLRKIAYPMVDVTADLASAARRPEVDEATDPVAASSAPRMPARFADVADHARHAADGITTLREMLNSAFETNLALSDVHLNMIMKKLSAWAAIIAVPTLVTGFFGMNVPYPGFRAGHRLPDRAGHHGRRGDHAVRAVPAAATGSDRPAPRASRRTSRTTSTHHGASRITGVTNHGRHACTDSPTFWNSLRSE